MAQQVKVPTVGESITEVTISNWLKKEGDVVKMDEIIAELEGVGRGAYTGSIGYLNRDGSCDLNILIRTITAQGQAFKFRAGAGIVADSVPAQELAETRAKAEGLLRALGVRS